MGKLDKMCKKSKIELIFEFLVTLFFMCHTKFSSKQSSAVLLNLQFFFLSFTFYRELFQFVTTHIGKFLWDWNTSSDLCRRRRIQPFFQKLSTVINDHLSANENYIPIPDPQFHQNFFLLDYVKTRTFFSKVT